MIKYAFCGSHGVGKSSACSYLAAHLKRQDPSKSVTVINENVREISKLTNNKLNNIEFQKLTFVDQLTKEFTNELLYDIIICDRTCLDTLIYGDYYNVVLPKEYLNLALTNLNTYNKIIFVRPDINDDYIANDGFRKTNLNTRNEIDKKFEQVLKSSNISYIEITTKDIINLEFINKIQGSL